MGAGDFWTDALGDWASQCENEPISKYTRKRIDIDFSIIVNKTLRSDIDKLVCASNSIYKCPNLLQNIIIQHKVFIDTGVNPTHAHDNMPPGVKKKRKGRRR